MRRLCSFAALLLLALWLPATLHCDLEHAGLIGEAPSCVDDCATDNCDQVESGHYKPSTGAVFVAAPLLQTCLDCAVVATTEPPTEIVFHFAEVESPPELTRHWQFVSRAAPLPGAPSLAS